MLIYLRPDADHGCAERLNAVLARYGLTATLREFGEGPVLLCTGDTSGVPQGELWAVEGVQQVLTHNGRALLSTRKVQAATTVVDLGDGVTIGGEETVMMAGPCSVECAEQILPLARRLRELGVRVLRGGIYKPRTSPFSFQGLGPGGFGIMDEVRRETGLKFVTEAMDERGLELAEAHADMIQIGSRNMQNFSLLKAVGLSRKPVLLKRGFSNTVEELLMAADYILAGGNTAVVLCERGIRTFANHTRNTLDLNAVPYLLEVSHLPVIVDPSHGTGVARFVGPMAMAALACGAQGLMIEVHDQPEDALSDGEQALTLSEFGDTLLRLESLATALGRPFHHQTEGVAS